jgi:steroid delta-isomerase-like uncharacterized protein
MASTEADANKAIVHRIYEAISSGNIDAMIQLLSSDYVDHSAPPGINPGPEGTRALLTMYRTSFPDLTVRAEDVLAEGDKVAARLRADGTHQGEFQGIPPTGKRTSITGIEIFSIVNGKVTERWGELNFLALLQQLGAIPTPDQASA